MQSALQCNGFAPAGLEAASAAPAAHGYSVEVVDRWQDLVPHAQPWDALLADSVEPNVFYSPAMVLAAMRHLCPAGRPAFLIVRATTPAAPLEPAQWCGFFPLMRHRAYRGAPVSNLRLLNHDFCFLRVPLVRAGCVEPVLAAVFEWFDRSGVDLLELGDQAGEGVYARALWGRLNARGALLAASHARALLLRGDSAERYIARAISSGRRKEYRRQERRLKDQGELRTELLCAPGDVDAAVAEFLALERAGWKGAQRTAMSCRDDHRAFFGELVRRACGSGRLQLSTLRLGERAIAMKCNLLAPPGAFAFKIAYAEDLARYSPGVLLELDNIRRLHEEPRLHWMDSCAAPGHPMIERLWTEQRTIQSWLVPLRPAGRLVTAALASFQRVRRALVRPSAAGGGAQP